MADKKLNEVTKVTDMAYVPVIMADGSIGQIAKADLASVVAGQMYHGGIRTLSDFNNATKQGTYYYSGGNSNELGTTNYGVLCVFVAGGYIAQLLLGPIVSVRMSYDAGTSWSLWKDFA